MKKQTESPTQDTTQRPNSDVPINIGHEGNIGVSGRVALDVNVRVDTREMAGWTPERIRALFDGVSLVQRAMYGMPIASDEPETEAKPC